MSELTASTADKIESRILTIRGLQVMLDRDLAELYEVEVKRLNEQVKRNIGRFPPDFCFQLTAEEFKGLILKSQFATSSGHGGIRKMPYAFTEHGVSMLSAVLRSDTAMKISVQIIRAFVALRKLVSANTGIIQRLESVEQKQIETDKKIDKIFDALESKDAIPKRGVFFDGQIFDAYVLVSDLIKSAKKTIVLIDNYVDESILLLMSKRRKNVSAQIYTRQISAQLQLDLTKHNSQYEPITIAQTLKVHDRFLTIDTTVYHIGASLKDLGKKMFAFSKMEIKPAELLKNV